MTSKLIEDWHTYMEKGGQDLLDQQLAEDCVFTSPVVHTPQVGKELSRTYLLAAQHVLGGEHFRYVREFDCKDRAVLEFVSELDGIQINGVDMIEWNAEGKITNFKVMVRPLKAIEAVHKEMAKRLISMLETGKDT